MGAVSRKAVPKISPLWNFLWEMLSKPNQEDMWIEHMLSSRSFSYITKFNPASPTICFYPVVDEKIG
jgi:hypothetical protein